MLNQPFIQLARHPFRFSLFLLKHLPSAYFSGLRTKSLDGENAVVTVPYKWFSKNPFRSTYFACLAMAAEMSTGLLAMAYTFKATPAVSMLVTGLEANYMKKATGLTTFTCTEGTTIREAIEGAIATGESRMVRIKSVGRNEANEIVAEFFISWSFKAKLK